MVRKSLLIFLLGVIQYGCSEQSLPSIEFSKEIADWTGTESVCEIHQILLVEDTLRIAYGLISLLDYPEGYFETSESIFPNAQSEIFEGCVIKQGSPEYASVLYCPLCRNAEKGWRIENPKSEPDEFQDTLDLPPPPDILFGKNAYDEPPKPIGGFQALQTAITYPKEARKSGLEGLVVVMATVDIYGKITDTAILKSLNRECDRASARAIKSVKWEPATIRGVPVSVRISIPVKFKLN